MSFPNLKHSVETLTALSYFSIFYFYLDQFLGSRVQPCCLLSRSCSRTHFSFKATRRFGRGANPLVAPFKFRRAAVCCGRERPRHKTVASGRCRAAVRFASALLIRCMAQPDSLLHPSVSYLYPPSIFSAPSLLGDFATVLLNASSSLAPVNGSDFQQVLAQ